MSVYDLPFCDVCGMPYKDGKPTCNCSRKITLAEACARLRKSTQEHLEARQKFFEDEMILIQEDQDDR